MKRLSLFFSLALTLALGACAQLGVTAPQTFMQGAAAAQVSVTAVRQTALDLLNAGTISAAQAKTARTAADAGNSAIDIAVAAYSAVCPQATGAPPTSCTAPAAQTQLTTAVTLLTAAQTLLNSYKGK